VSANGGHVRFSRDIASVLMDLKTSRLDFNVAAAGGAGDAAPDHLIVNGTSGNDVAIVTGDAAGMQVIGPAARVNVTGAEATNDRLTVRTLAGDDVLDATSVCAGREAHARRQE
jgi:hypothetical protein